MKNINEISEVCRELGITYSLLSKDKSLKIINEAFNKFKVLKKTGHLAIHNNDSKSIPIEANEFVFSLNLKKEPVYIFFDQGNILNKDSVICIDNAQLVGAIMENSYGMEYFLTNERLSYLIAVNWYVIEVTGEAKKWYSNLIDK